MSLELAVVMSAVVGLVAGFLVTRAFFSEAKNTVIHVRHGAGVWTAETSNKEVHLKRLMFMRWNVVEQSSLPADAYIELRFAGDNSPFTEQRPKDDKKPGKRLIHGLVPTGAENGSYKYTVYLIDGRTETPIEDPVIVIEGKRG
jgi:hypothetical protein